MRSVYPKIAIEPAVSYIVKNRAGIKQADSFSRVHALGLLGFSQKSGAGQSVVSSLIHYGLLEKTNKHYRFTALAKEIAEVHQKNTRRQLIAKAALFPPVFKDLYKAYQRKEKDKVESILKHYGVPEDQKEQVLKIFNAARLYVKITELTSVAANAGKPFSRVKKINVEDSEDSREVVTIDFGDGMIVNVPKKIILKAYMEELQKLQNRMQHQN